VLEVRVYDTDGPVEGAGVFFNGGRIGTTDFDGATTGEVPYERELNVGVEFPDGDSCDLSTETAGLAGAGVPAAGPRLSSLPSPTLPADGGSNVSVPVNGSVEVTVSGEAVPGETVAVRATIEGHDMENADVLVNGERVGKTDFVGEYELRIPEDGRGSLNVTVVRGEFAGSEQVVLELLTLSVQPRGVISLPGGTATVVARRGPDPAVNATVAIDGETVGRTDENGELALTLPTDTDANLSVATDAQTAATSTGAVFGATLLLVIGHSLVVAVGGVAAARRRGRRSAGAVVYAGVAALTVAAVVALYGWVPGGVAALLSALPLVAFAFRTGDGPSTDRARSLLSWLRSVPGRVPTLVVETARWLGDVLDDVGRVLGDLRAWLRGALSDLRTWLAAQPRSLGALVRRLLGWVLDLPGRLAAAVTPARVAGVPVAATATLDGYVALGWAGAVVGALGSVVAAAMANRTTPEPPSAPSTATGPAMDREPTASPTVADPDADPTTIRERWRRFARWVRPGDWTTSSAVEVERTATEQGYPDDAAAALTEAFRRQEYGGDRSVPERLRDRARRAYDRLDSHRRDGGDQ
jgi:hypothetical protein